MLYSNLLLYFLLPLSLSILNGRLYFILLYSVCIVIIFRRKIYVGLVTLPRDLHLVHLFIKLNYSDKWMQKVDFCIPRAFAEQVAKHPNKVAIIHDGRELTYNQIEDLSNRGANKLLSLGLNKDEVVCLLLPGCPEYPAAWLSITKVGLTASLINTNLRGEGLTHCLTVAKPRAVICTKDDASNLPVLEGLAPIIIHLEDLWETSSEPPPSNRLPGYRDVAFYIYTSGTTGMPKPAIITHARALFMMRVSQMGLGLKSDDVVYTPLPLYHTAGGMLGLGNIITNGATVVIRNKFSASKFWEDCRQHRCTAAQYIGETCRYLLAQPESPMDKIHSVRVLYGNGLRPQIWEDFSKRFAVGKICEFYGSTEGNSNMFNAWGKPGAVGYLPWFAAHFYSLGLICVDEDTNQPIRGRDGLCIRCRPGEPGLLVGKIDKSKATTNFSGYADKEATKKKVLCNVFKHGDAAFNSGDIMVMDEYGYFYFRDRTGDTFRWRGENVSTTEVEGIMAGILKMKDCVVYGVEIPNLEGRAGMAAIVDQTQTLDLTGLLQRMKNALPLYALPLFIRLCPSLPLTGTFKIKKYQLAKEGFDPTKVPDPVFFLDSKSDSYVPMDEELYGEIVSGKRRL